ncbi:MAG TPA: ABC transporter permease [Candidatus Altiarchaeales archaeon]|nr:ABC transporter permease [Candidatus Altiarchaeales archaeon]
MIGDYMRFAVDGILHRKFRSWLTMLGIFVGIMAVVSLISLGQGLQRGIDEQFEKVGGDRILITPGGEGVTAGAGVFSSAKIGEKDLDVVLKNKGVDSAIGMTRDGVLMEYGGVRVSAMIFGIPTDPETTAFLDEISFMRVSEGRYLRAGERHSILIGVSTGELFGTEVELKIGDKIQIEENSFKVVGITEKSGNPMHDMKVVVPLEVAEELSGKSGVFDTISVKVKKGFIPGDVAESLKQDLRKSRGVKGGEEDFSVETAEDLISTFKNILAIVQLVLTGIAAISLAVGGIGIMTTMYTSVLERTRQIGVMKAVGAQNSDILLIFLFEAGLLGLVGGIVGVVFGMAVSVGVEKIAFASGLDILKAYTSPDLIVGVLLFSFIVGCASGFFPAMQAAKMKPIDALKY